MTKQLGGALGIIQGGVSLFVVEGDTGNLTGLGQNGMTQRQPRKGGGVEGSKGVKWCALEGVALNRLGDEAVVESGVVGHYDAAVTI